jgi:hypothetical protein
MTIDDLKCCGNCDHRHAGDIGSTEVCIEPHNFHKVGTIYVAYDIFKCCPYWEFDGWTAQERQSESL